MATIMILPVHGEEWLDLSDSTQLKPLCKYTSFVPVIYPGIKWAYLSLLGYKYKPFFHFLQECHPQPTEVRGCPFTSTNAEDVSTLIKKFVPHSTNILDNVMKEVVLGRASAACQLVFAFQVFMLRQSSHNWETETSNKVTSKYVPEKENDCKSLNLVEQGKDFQDISMLTNKDNGKWKSKLELSDFGSKDCCRHDDTRTVMRSENIKHDCKCKEDCRSCQSFSTAPRARSEHPRESRGIPSCDIEDLGTLLPACSFTRPSHYYLSMKKEQGLIHSNNL